MSEEEVLVIPEARLLDLGAFSGFKPFCSQSFQSLLAPEFMQFRPRSTVEEDTSFKQLIPYVVLQCYLEGQPHVFQYTRGKGQGEKRLHALRSVGIGGHISREDAAGEDLYRSGMMRELTEEMIIDSPYQEELVGFIYDDTNAVGRVHLGVVHRLTLDQPAARARESELTDSGFVSVHYLKSQWERLESWSQLCLANLF
ncbi:MAG TPA: phosphoesterase [Planctomycetaceae bacterium]|nr:phosphoesterase [Planctomycetaceae bacterium]